MDSVEIEHLLAPILGIRTGTRSDVNDADAIRSNDPKRLVRALTKILPRLAKRTEGMEESETKAWIGKTLRDFDFLKDTLEKTGEKANGPALFLLWGASATALHWVHLTLKGKGL